MFDEKVDEGETIVIRIDSIHGSGVTERKFTDVVIEREDYNESVLRELKHGLMSTTRQYLKQRFGDDREKINEMFWKIWK